MAQQKQINLQVLLLLTGIFFTSLSAARACFVPYVSIYLRQLGLSSSQVGVILGSQSVLVASTASCVGRFLMRFRYARLFLLLAILLYLGGVLSFTVMPASSKVLIDTYCARVGNSTTSSYSQSVGEVVKVNGSVHDVVTERPTQTPIKMYSTRDPTTTAIKILSVKSEPNIRDTTPHMPVSERSGASFTRTPSNQDVVTGARSGEFQTKHNWDDFINAGTVFDPKNERMSNIDKEKIDWNLPLPTAGSSFRSHDWSGNRKPGPRLQQDSFVSNKRYGGQPGQREPNLGRYDDSEKSWKNWNWDDDDEPERGYDADRYRAWDWDKEETLPSRDSDEISEADVLDWLLRRGREKPSYNSYPYVRTRVKRSGILVTEATDSVAAEEHNQTDKPAKGNRIDVNATSTIRASSSSPSFWLALLIIGLTGTFAGPIEHMIDTALYHQLDSIDELDKYKRPSLLTMPVFAIVGLASALIVDSTPCFLSSGSSRMTIHFYMSAVCIGVLFLVGIVVPLSHKVKNQQEGKFTKSMKFLFSDGHTAVMCLTLIMTALISSCADTFLFWLIQDLHGQETTMGVSLAVAFMTELPMSMVFTPWLVQKLGNVWLLALGTACLGVQNLYYSVLWTPWAVVPIQLLHALSHSAIRGCILAFLNEAAPPGMGKAIQITVLGLEQGLGCTIGSVTWGILYGLLKVKMIFVAAAITAMVWTVILIVCACRLPTKKRFMYAKLLQSDMEMEMKGGGFGSDSEDNEEKEWLHDAIKSEDEE